jgi:AcrR family transcriptional regulator
MKPTPPPYQRRSTGARVTPTRQALLDATRAVVARRGVGDTTSRHITDEAGASLGAITYYFGSKDALIAEALAGEIERLAEPALAALESSDDPAARMARAMGLLLAALTDQADRVPLFVETLAAAGRGDDAAPAVRAVLATLQSRLEAVIAELRGDDLVPAWVDPTAMAGLIVATASGIVVHQSLELAGPGPEALAGQFAALLLDAGR